jgi:hypothetical protein
LIRPEPGLAWGSLTAGAAVPALLTVFFLRIRKYLH